MNPNESIYGYTPGGGGVPKKKGQGVTPPVWDSSYRVVMIYSYNRT